MPYSDPEKQVEYQRKNKLRYRGYHLKYQYGITLTVYEKLLLEQNGCCAICGNTNYGKNLFVDHDHETGKVRGLLCRNCNSALSWFKDDLSILIKAVQYLTHRSGG